jgi:hypothetical protein
MLPTEGLSHDALAQAHYSRPNTNDIQPSEGGDRPSIRDSEPHPTDVNQGAVISFDFSPYSV